MTATHNQTPTIHNIQLLSWNEEQSFNYQASSINTKILIIYLIPKSRVVHIAAIGSLLPIEKQKVHKGPQFNHQPQEL